MFVEQMALARKDPMRVARNLTQYMNENNARLSQAAVLMTGINYVNQQLAQNTGYAVMPGLSNAANTILMLGAFFSNDTVSYCFNVALNATSQVMPDSIKQRFMGANDDSEEASANEDSSAKVHTM